MPSLPRMMPPAVSYTHLDVYKRQGLRIVEIRIKGQLPNILAVQPGELGHIEDGRGFGHAVQRDVYKRQAIPLVNTLLPLAGIMEHTIHIRRRMLALDINNHKN